MGSYCSVMNNTSGTMYCKYGADMDALELAFAIIGDIGAFIPEIGEAIELLAKVGETVIAIINLQNEAQIKAMSGNLDQWFKDHGYGARSPGTAYKSEKLSLSLVVSAYCGLVTNVGNGRIEVRVGTMTCWSGPTNNDVNHYNVSDCDWQRIQASNSNSGVNATAINAAVQAAQAAVIAQAAKNVLGAVSGVAAAGRPKQDPANLAANPQVLAQIQARLNAVGHDFNQKPGVPPVH